MTKALMTLLLILLLLFLTTWLWKINLSEIPNNLSFILFAAPKTGDFEKDNDEHNNAWLLMKQKELRQRSIRVHEACRSEGRKGAKVHWKRFAHLVIAEKYKIAYCWHAKVASTTILRYFLELGDHISPELKLQFQDSSSAMHSKMLKSFPRLGRRPAKGRTGAVLEMLREMVVFSFVRHPFERLASAFLNKVLGENYHKLKDKTEGVFANFIDIVLREAQRFNCSRNKHRPCKSDIHWRPLYGRCAYCDMPYIIGNVETFHEDMWYIAYAAGLTKRLNLTRQEKKTLKMNSSNFTTIQIEEKTLEYFDQLNQKQKQAIYEFYKFDFDLFGYDPEPYFIREGRTS